MATSATSDSAGRRANRSVAFISTRGSSGGSTCLGGGGGGQQRGARGEDRRARWG
jgi:hypothetical protein